MNIEVLKGHIPDKVIAELPDVMNKFGINTEVRLAHFLGQCAAESGGFRSKRENLNYSVDGLKKTFGKYFKQQGLAESYARHPEKIANYVYANRMANGAEASGDGWKFRGAGAIQLTGRSNFKAFSDAVGDPDIMENTDLVADRYMVTSAAWYFHNRKLLATCDKGINDATIKELTKKINGGYNGLDARTIQTKKFYSLLTA